MDEERIEERQEGDMIGLLRDIRDRLDSIAKALTNEETEIKESIYDTERSDD